MRSGLGLVMLWAVSACGQGSKQAGGGQGSIDTSMVFVATPPASTSRRSGPPSQDSVLATVAAYKSKRVSVDVAARVVVDYFEAGGHLDPGVTRNDRDLMRAIARELDRRTLRP